MNLTPHTWQFSLFYKEGWGVKNTHPLVKINLKKLIEIYQSDYLIKRANLMLNAKDPIEQKIIKHQLPYITANGVFSERSNENITHYNSNLLVLDIDNLGLETAKNIQNQLSKEKGCVLSVLSPRLEGVKAIFLLNQNLDRNNHYQHLKQNLDHITDCLSIPQVTLDRMQFTLSQAMFVSNSEHMYFNEDADAVDWMLKEFTPSIPSTQCNQSAINGNGVMANYYRSRIEKYLNGQCDRVLSKLEGRKAERHHQIYLVKDLATWRHYADEIFMDTIKSRLLLGIVRMYKDRQDAINERAIISFETIWNTNEKCKNKIIIEIMNEYSTNLKSLEQ